MYRLSYLVYALERLLENCQQHSGVCILYDVACTYLSIFSWSMNIVCPCKGARTLLPADLFQHKPKLPSME